MGSNAKSHLRRGSGAGMAGLMLLSLASSPKAGPLLRPAGSPMPGSSASAAAAARAEQMAQAAARASHESLQRAAEALLRMRAQQDAARAAAAAGASGVPNGLAPGGLVIAPGAPTDPTLWNGAGLPTQSPNGERTEVDITQTQPKAILSWQTFNVGRETDVHFDQRAGGDDASQWIALNRVSDPSGRPSQILGSIRAEGQIYLINRNGIIFGGTSQINVGSLIASSLDLPGVTLADRNQRFLDGILFNPLDYQRPVLAFSAESGASSQGITVEAGATLTATGGRAMLLGQNVVNAGTIQATDGEVVLAAGEEIFLNRNYQRGQELRSGFRVPLSDVRGITVGVNRGGRVENQGAILSDRGSINIQAKSILQAGLLQATTSADANGYINLTAGDGIVLADPTMNLTRPYPDPLFGGTFGELTFAEGSTTQILPDADGKLAVGFDQFKPSKMELYGRYVTFERNSTLFAPGANVAIEARRQGTFVQNPSPDDSRIYLEQGARIDLSGLRGVDLPMERNTISAEVRANELRDNPLMRDSFLRGQKVYFDARLGDKLINGTGVADLSGYYDLIARSVPELMTQGGSLKVNASQIITRAGSVIDLSGGSLHYQPGYVRSTMLRDEFGRVVPIEDADPNVVYVGFAGGYIANHSRWGVSQQYNSPLFGNRGTYEAGYLEGRSAGTLTVGTQDVYGQAPRAYGYRIFDGDIVADVVAGQYQLQAPTGATAKDVTRIWQEAPSGATLNFGWLTPGSEPNRGNQAFGGNIIIGQAPLLPENFTFNSRVDPSMEYNSVLPARYFDGKTFSIVNLSTGAVGADASASGGRLTIGDGVVVDLGNYGKLNFEGTRADINGTIRAPGGSVSLVAVRVAPRPFDPNDPSWTPTPDWSTLDPALKPQINLGATGVIDVAGRWVNELLNPADGTQTSFRGGSVSLVTSNNLNLAAGSLIDVSGGGRLSSDGRKVTAGAPGSIVLINAHAVAGVLPGTVSNGPRDGAMNLAGTLRGYGLNAGGSLTIGIGGSVLIADQAPGGVNALVLSPDFFRQGGFANFIVSGASGTTVADGTVIAPAVESYLLDRSGQSIRTGGPLFGSARLGILTDDLAQPMSLTLSAPVVDANGNLLVLGADPFHAWVPLRVDSPGMVKVGTGAQIIMAPKSTVRLISATKVFVDGTVFAPGGLIDLRSGTRNPNSTGDDPPAVRLGENARLLAPGYVKSTLQGQFTRRSVEDGGRVSISTFRFDNGSAEYEGNFQDGFVLTDPKSLIDVSGVQGVADLDILAQNLSRPTGRFVERVVDGAAGSVAIAMQAGVLGGELRLAPGGPSGRGGRLEVDAPHLTVAQSVPGGLRVDVSSPIDPHTPDLKVFADRVNASGADDLVLMPTGDPTAQPQRVTYRELVFDGDVSLSTRRSIQLGGPLIAVKTGSAGNVSLSSSYISFSPRNAGDTRDVIISGWNLPAQSDLGGRLTAKADLIDIGYAVAFGCSGSDGACANAPSRGGFADIQLVSKGDIRLKSDGLQSEGPRIPGHLNAGGTLTLDAAQVYLSTAVFPKTGGDGQYLISAGTSVTIRGNGAEAPMPYSYGERLTVHAPRIVQGGVLRAPLGEIQLEGTESVTLLPGSLTSTSLEGRQMVWKSGGDVQEDNPFLNLLSPSDSLDVLPTKTVRIQSANVTVSAGATVDVSGGGDVSAWQFIRGTGGSRNILTDPGTFAILPSYGDGPVPAGPRRAGSTQPRVGDKVYLEGVPGLPAGLYTLLPADYALLQGGLLIRTLGSGLANSQTATQRPDGSSLVYGYRSVDGTPIRDVGNSRFLVMPQSVFTKYSTFAAFSFNEFVATKSETDGVQARAGLDAGSVVLDAGRNLVLNGTGRFAPAPGGLFGNLDITTAGGIAITGSGAPAPAGYLAIDAGALSRFGAGSILIGGTRSNAAGGTGVSVGANDIVVINDTSSPLTAPEILLAAKNSLTVAQGSVISAEGAQASDSSALLISGDGAFLRASTGNRVDVRRTNATGSAGVLDIASGVTLQSVGSVALDASKSVSLNEQAVLDAAQLDLSSVRVSIGDVPNPPGPDLGTVISGATLDKLGRSRNLLIRGSQSIDLYGTFHFGNRDGALTLDTARLNGKGAAGDTATLVAGELTLRNSGPNSSDAESSAGGLSLQANTLVLGPGELLLSGFGNVSAAAGVVQATGVGTLNFTGPVSLSTDLVTATAGSDYAVKINGTLSLARNGGPAQAATDFGGRLSLTGSTLNLDTTVDMPSGVFEATATGGDLTLGGSAELKLRGTAVDFRDVVKFAPAGTIRLTASGKIIAASGSRLDVSGDERGGDAGRIEVAAPTDSVSLAGEIKGTAASGYLGGGFSLEGQSLSDFGLLNAALERGGMNRSRSIHVASGDLRLEAGESLTAHDVLLRSDEGAVFIAGNIRAAGDATSPSGGRIRLIGGGGLTLDTTARLDARAGETKPGAFEADSGYVEIAATGGRLYVHEGALVDVSGGKQGGGQILVRAPRTGDDVAIDRLDGQFLGAREGGRAIVGMRSYQTTDVNDALRDQMLTDSDTWAANGPAIQARLGTSAFEVSPGISVNSGSDLALNAVIDLSTHRYNGAPGYLELKAAGNINVNANLSDGFASAAPDARLLPGRSWSYAFEAGGDVTLGAGVTVRTGTGNIRVNAGRDLRFTDNLSLLYTAGSSTPTPDEFHPPNPDTHQPPQFPTQGGDISLIAGHDIVAPVTHQSASDWLFRYGHNDWTGDPQKSTVGQQTSWSIIFENFQQGVGALGGGNVEVIAGHDVIQLAVSLPTTGYLTTRVGEVPQPGDLHIRGGGNLTLYAGHDLKGGVFMLGQGTADVTAGNRLTYGDGLVNQRNVIDGLGQYTPKTLAPLFGLADAALVVNARSGAEIEGVFDPMLQGQICQNSGCNADRTQVTDGSAFYGMTERTAMKVISVAGNIRYDANPWASVDVTRDPLHQNPFEAKMFLTMGDLDTHKTSTTGAFERAPGTVQLAALHDDVLIAKKLTAGNTQSILLAPTNNGTLELLGKNGLGGVDDRTSLALPLLVKMLDVGAAYRHGALYPFSVTGYTEIDPQILSPTTATNLDRGFTPAHIDDATPARLYSMSQTFPRGSIVTVPKALNVYSGKDLSGTFNIQNNQPDDLSSFVAERDVISLNLFVAGIGDVAVEAGRNIKNPGPNPARIISAGNRPDASNDSLNFALPAKQGANIYLYAGSSKDVDYDGFAAIYLDPQNSSHVVRTYLEELKTYMERLGFTGLSDAERIARFQTLPLQSRKTFVDQIFFTELKETGLDVTDPTSPRFQNYNRGYAAVRQLFPRDTSLLSERERSNILLNAAPVQTESGGNITILAPTGRVEIGGASPLNDAPTRGNGVVTRKGGSIRIMADQNIDLFASRVFSLLGGDITMWTSEGDITAGVGAKTTVFRPPLTYTIDNDATVSLNVFGLQTGSGIGVLDAGGTGRRVASRLDLLAPHGEVNAGDAGIRVVGDINIAALRVVGFDNIQFTGSATGVPKVVVPNIAAITEADKSLTAATQNVGPAAQPRAKPEELPSIVTVEVIGYETPQSSEGNEERRRPKR